MYAKTLIQAPLLPLPYSPAKNRAPSCAFCLPAGLPAGTLTATKQDDSKSCYAKLLTKAMGQIDWNQSALSIDRQVRGLYSWPGAYTSCKGKMLKIWQAKPVEEEGIAAYSMPGSIAKVTKNEIFVQTGDGVLCLQEVQLEGKKRMKVHDFLLGCNV